MTHTSTEQPEARDLAYWIAHTTDNPTAALIQSLRARVQELEAERDEADRRAGRAERHMAGLNDDVRRFEAARRRMKAQWGVHDNVSFDVVWQQALDAKASQAQRVPLSVVDAIKQGLQADEATRHHCRGTTNWAAAMTRFYERAHGITQEKQG